ncbi:putative F-box domain-containing protein [Helianthus annuus]|nr:putative F-box domain-containing protein [Helianthus annuus]
MKHKAKLRFKDSLPSEIIFNILSRMPVKSLARFRCVSKLWCDYIDDPYLKIIHDQQYPEEPTIIFPVPPWPSIRFYATELVKRDARVLEAKTIPFLEFNSKQGLFLGRHFILGSCNGLVYLSQSYGSLRPEDLSVVNPVRKEYYELPPADHLFDQKHFELHGLGFDDSTNTFKMVVLSPSVRAMVHVFGTRSWRVIPLNPITTRLDGFNISCNQLAVFVCGCLHWLIGNGKIIRLDMRTEEFELIDLPKTQRHVSLRHEMVPDRLVDLHGEVGYVYCRFLHGLEVWVLKEREWVIHCRFNHRPPLPAYAMVTVLGSWNKDGDILMKAATSGVGPPLFVYSPKSGLLKEVKLIRKPVDFDFDFADAFIYPSSLLSIHSIKAYSIKKTDVSKSVFLI